MFIKISQKFNLLSVAFICKPNVIEKITKNNLPFLVDYFL